MARRKGGALMYLEIDEGFFDHPKTLRLCGMMRDKNAWAYVLRLWKWACRSAPDGRLDGMGPEEIEIAAGYTPLDGKLYLAMAGRFIDETNGQPAEIHDWMKHTGAAIKKMNDEAERKRVGRAHAKQRDCGRDDCVMCGAARQGADEDTKEPDASADAAVSRPANGAGRPDTVQSSPVQSSPDKESPPPAGAQDPSGSAASTETMTGYVLMARFGAVRAECVPGVLDWDTPRVANGKDETFAARLSANPAAMAVAIPSMRRFFERAKAGDYGESVSSKILKDPTYAFGCWMSKFHELREEFAGVSPNAPAARNTGPPRTRDVRVGHAPAPQNYEYPDGEQPL